MAGSGNGAARVAPTGDQSHDRKPSAAEIASRGLGDSRQTRRLCSAIVRDVLAGDLAERAAGVAVNAVGKALTTVRMERVAGGVFAVDPDSDPAEEDRRAEIAALKARLALLES